MAKQIPRDFINDLLARTDIVTLINKRIKLKKQGKEYLACCPFHHEKTPSFTVSAEKQFYHCFGCGAHGNAIDFLLNYDRMTFIESIEELATIHGLALPETKGSLPDTATALPSRSLLYEVMQEAAHFYHKMLYSPAGEKALLYLHQRGLQERVIRHFLIGFAPFGWQTLVNYLLHQKKREKQLLNASGLAILRDDGKFYDRFRQRIIFPIRDRRNRVIALGGRGISNDIMPKYLNSPETTLFHKSDQLYGLCEILGACASIKQIIVVEGYMDVLSLNQHELKEVVATLGTTISHDQLLTLFRFTDTLICCFDGDSAGKKAAWRTLVTALPLLHDGRQLRFTFLPEGEDPDSWVQKAGSIAFNQQIAQSNSFVDFLFANLVKQANLTTPDGRATFISQLLPLVEKIPGHILRAQVQQALGNQIGVIDNHQLHQLFSVQPEKKNFIERKLKLTTMRILIGLLIQRPNLVQFVPDLAALQNVRLAGLSLFKEIVQLCKAQVVSTAQILEYYRDTKYYPQLEKLILWNDITDEAVVATFQDTLNHLVNLALGERLDKLIQQARTVGELAQQEYEEIILLSQICNKKKQK